MTPRMADPSPQVIALPLWPARSADIPGPLSASRGSAVRDVIGTSQCFHKMMAYLLHSGFHSHPSYYHRPYPRAIHPSIRTRGVPLGSRCGYWIFRHKTAGPPEYNKGTHTAVWIFDINDVQVSLTALGRLQLLHNSPSEAGSLGRLSSEKKAQWRHSHPQTSVLVGTQAFVGNDK